MNFNIGADEIDVSTVAMTEVITTSQTQWWMPSAIYHVVMILLFVQLVVGVLSNILLIATICNSPSLKTPPNTHLVNICVNNLVICISILISFISILLDSLSVSGRNVVGNLQLFLTTLCFLNYATIFSAIGYYRCKTVKSPTISLQSRSNMITKSIALGWLLSIFVSSCLSISCRNSLLSLTWNPFRKLIDNSDLATLNVTSMNSQQTAFMYITLFVFVSLMLMIINSYYHILKVLFRANSVCKNKVEPWEGRNSSFSSDGNDLMEASQRSYRPEESSQNSPRTAFTISNGNVMIDNFMVHYQKENNSVSFIDEAFALENPLKAQKMYMNQNLRTNPMASRLSDASQNSKNGTRHDFTDISPGAELHRFQYIKNKRALQNQSLKRDRISLGGATKNSIIMITTYITCSLPGFICSIPGVLDTSTIPDMTLPLLFCQMVFYLNVPAYPIWYLVFSKRVRKCLLKLYDTILIKCRLKP